MARRIAITGATGLIGTALTQALLARGDTVIGFSRNPTKPAPNHPQYIAAQWQRTDQDALVRALAGCDTVVNLMGASIAGRRWTPAYRHSLFDTRVPATAFLVDACARLDPLPTTFLSASGSGFYGYANDTATVDETSPAGSDFLATLCQQWESAAQQASAHGMRVATVRTAVVLDGSQGALPQMAMPFRFFVGGPVGTGHQPVPWIHRDDVVALYLWLIDTATAQGTYNAVAPELVDNARFSATIAKALQRPCWLPVPGFALRIIFGALADALLLNGQPMRSVRVDPQVVGYRFLTLESALRAIWKKPS